MTEGNQDPDRRERRLDARELARIRRAAERGLAERLGAVSGVCLGRSGRVAALEDAFVASVPAEARAASVEDVSAGDGGELRQPDEAGLHPRFHSSRSSCALAVNGFGPWRCAPEGLALSGLSGFSSLGFEAKLPIRSVRGRAPNLDLVADGPIVLAIESKLLEHLSRAKPAAFAAAYERVFTAIAHQSWQDAYRRLRGVPDRFELFGAAQILKHYLGLKSAYPDRPARLLYLFWEPENAEALSPLALHREEIAEFSSWVKDPKVNFVSASYPELWDEWENSDLPMPEGHLDNLRSRYALRV